MLFFFILFLGFDGSQAIKTLLTLNHAEEKSRSINRMSLALFWSCREKCEAKLVLGSVKQKIVGNAEKCFESYCDE